jgi:transmembrane sensor
MNDPHTDKHIEAVRRDVRVRSWRPADVDAAWTELGQRQARRHQRTQILAKLGGGALALVVLFVVGFGVLRTFVPAPVEVAATRETTPGDALQFGDGTDVHFDPGTRLDVLERTPDRVVVRMATGTANFRVRHEPRRLFRVEAGNVVIEDLGTQFKVDYRDDKVAVSVSEGSVAVSFRQAGQLNRVTLEAGKSAVYPSEPAPAEGAPSTISDSIEQSPPHAEALAREPAATTLETPARAGAPGATSNGEPRPNVDWRELARGGDYQRAFDLLSRRSFRDVNNEPSDLLLASDVARRSGHPGEGASLLRKLLARHAADPRAPSAAFSLGWVLMTELGQPREAAAAFARAEALAPGGNLAEDAFARSVEAWHRAGEKKRARADVDRYRKRYPNGRYRGMLERLVDTP